MQATRQLISTLTLLAAFSGLGMSAANAKFNAANLHIRNNTALNVTVEFYCVWHDANEQIPLSPRQHYTHSKINEAIACQSQIYPHGGCAGDVIWWDYFKRPMRIFTNNWSKDLKLNTRIVFQPNKTDDEAAEKLTTDKFLLYAILQDDYDNWLLTIDQIPAKTDYAKENPNAGKETYEYDSGGNDDNSEMDALERELAAEQNDDDDDDWWNESDTDDDDSGDEDGGDDNKWELWDW